MEVIHIGTSSPKEILVKIWTAENVLLSIFSVFLKDPSRLSGVINTVLKGNRCVRSSNDVFFFDYPETSSLQLSS
ncbi:hypothetical protein Y032_0338g2942 [Ancylostoma ceylanicum]|uniref:Uncharacterized protein n=1 Tax=Ancylostoma ceylanicum TaxID=53326 RepID=A0A016RYY1_9BILA|nr:hypothetical protein Y032_0338g2942 [Ancylostoma ceylanicum]